MRRDDPAGDQIAHRDDLAVAGAFRHGEVEKGFGDAFRRRQGRRVLAREDPGRAAGCARCPGSIRLARTVVVRDLAGIDPHQRFERRPCSRHRRPNRAGRRAPAAQVTKIARPACDCRSSGSSARISRQLAVRLTSMTSLPQLGVDMARAATSAPNTPALPTSMSSRPKRWWSAAPSWSILSNSRRSSGTSVALPPAGADLVVDLLEAATGARHQDDMRALGRQSAAPPRRRCRARRR